MDLITVSREKCERCGLCARDCTNDVLLQEGKNLPQVVAVDNCIDCGHCLAVCPSQAIKHARLAEGHCMPVDHPGITAGNMENFLLSRRSIRLYRQKPVEKEVLERLLRVANMAPTAKNCQERRFIVVTDPEKRNEIKTALLANNEKVIRLLKLITGRVLSRFIDPESVEALKKMLRGFRITRRKAEQGKDAIFHQAPCVIFICGIGKDLLGKDNCLTAQQYLMAQAQAMGLGTCIIGYAQAAPKVLVKHLDIPKHYKVYGVVTLGYPKVNYQRTTDRNAPQVTWLTNPELPCGKVC